MDTIQFVEEKKDEILAIAARHNATGVRVVVPTSAQTKTVDIDGLNIVASFSGDAKLPQYFEALKAFETDLEIWLDIQVHVYDANGFKGQDGEEFLRNTVAL